MRSMTDQRTNRDVDLHHCSDRPSGSDSTEQLNEALLDMDQTPAITREPRESLGLHAVCTSWERRLIARIIVADLIAVAIANWVAWMTRSRFTSENLAIFGQHFPYSVLALVSAPAMIACLAMGGAYNRSIIGSSPLEYSRVTRIVTATLTVVCATSFLGKVAVSRGIIAVFFPMLLLTLMVGRYVVRKNLHRSRAKGKNLHRLVLVGRRPAVSNLTAHLRRSPHAGYKVIGAYMPGADERPVTLDEPGVVVLGEPDQLLEDLAHLEIDAIALSGGQLFEKESLRSLAWRLHGSGITLLMAPDMVDIAGPRIVSRPAAGLPMLLVDEPRTTGVAQTLKSLLERSTAFVALILISPFLAAIALIVKFTSPGPVFYSQTRVGRNHNVFQMLKFRSMVEGADELLDHLVDENEHDGVLFKIQHDPRITRIGSFIRRFSIDELPQLWNVVRGDMALVGPRPPLPSEVAKYGTDVSRRLMVKPGITGLWQVSGRSDLSWEDTVRLDLYYVENWSLSLDMVILAKTVKAVITGDGAY